ncbi:MAG TPA: hypothetical protein VF337_00285, partial [Candidatus Limnocylindrales bacterium]
MRTVRLRARHVAAGLSLAGLIAAGLITYSLTRDMLPVPIAARSEPTAASATATAFVPASPTGSASLPTDDQSHLAAGSLVYARDGILFVQTGSIAVQITSPIEDSKASDPAWSPDGKWLYYIDTRRTNGWWYNPNSNADSYYLLTYPV